MKRSLAATAVAVALMITACSDSTGPRPFSGTYVLARIDGTGPPLVTSDHTFSNGERLVHSVVYDTIQFTSATTARRSESFQSVRFDATGTPQQANATSASYTGTVERDGNIAAITWASLSGSLVQELELVHGTLEWQTMVGMICSDNCPLPRMALFTYARR